jgi:hypothetical protein
MWYAPTRLPECRRKTSTSLDTGDGLVTCTGPVTGVVLRTPGPVITAAEPASAHRPWR